MIGFVLFTLSARFKHVPRPRFYNLCSFTKHAQNPCNYTYIAINGARTCCYILQFNLTTQAFRVLALSPALSAEMLNVFILIMIESTVSATFVGTVELSPALQCCFQRFEAKMAINNIEEGKGD